VSGDSQLAIGRRARFFNSCGSFASDASEVDCLKRAQTEVCVTKKLTIAAPHPGCFLQEWQTKGLWLTKPVRVAAKGLKVAGFLVSCRSSVRVARKGLSEGKLTVESLKLKKETSRKLKAETLSAQRGGRRKADPSLRSG